MCTAVFRNPNPLSQHLGSHTRALLVSQDRWHLLTSLCNPPLTNNIHVNTVNFFKLAFRESILNTWLKWEKNCVLLSLLLGLKMLDTELTRQLNSMEDTSRLYQTVQDNKSSRIQATLPFSIHLYVKKLHLESYKTGLGSERYIFFNSSADAWIRSSL